MKVIDLTGQKALIVGIGNEKSLSAAVARCLHSAGADLALTYHNARTLPYVKPLAEEVEAEILLPCEVSDSEQMAEVCEQIRSQWGRLDMVFHAVGAVPKKDLRGQLVECSEQGFLEAMQVSCYSFIHLARSVVPLISEGGSILTLTFFGAERVVDHYNVMGPVKAALQSSVQYLAHELGPHDIRVNALSAGPVTTRSSSGITHFEKLIEEVEKKAPLRRTASLEEIGDAALFLLSDYASAITGEVLHVDSGHHIEGMVFDDEPEIEISTE